VQTTNTPQAHCRAEGKEGLHGVDGRGAVGCVELMVTPRICLEIVEREGSVGV
jgi:hypothetical protein